MPPGPDGFVRDPRYREEFDRARGLVLGRPRRWRVIYHYDGDGIAGASSLLRAFDRLGYPAQATALTGVERDRIVQLLAATPGPVLLVDSGASWLDLYGKHPHPVVVLDHHRYPGVPHPPELPPHVAFVNPLDWGVDGMSELCGATLAWLFTVFLDPANWDNAPWGLSGAIADRQHVGGFKGLNGTLVGEAVARKVLEVRRGMPLFGGTVGEALSESIDPYVRGLSNHPAAAGAFLGSLGIAPERPVASLAREEHARLTAALKERLDRDGVLPEFTGMLDADRWYCPGLALDAEEVSNRQNAAGREGVPEVGVAWSLGDPAAAERAVAAERAWRQGILRGLARVEEAGVHSSAHLKWFESPEMPLAGTQAGLAMSYLLPPDVPVFVFSDVPNARTKVSSRGLVLQVERGLDLATVCRTAAAAVGGEGGGHRVASGATIPPGTRAKFLEVADAELGRQLGAAGAGA